MEDSEDSIACFKKAVDEFRTHTADYFNLEGDFAFPSLVRYRCSAFSTTENQIRKPIAIQETHSFCAYGKPNIPHLRHLTITANFNEYGFPENSVGTTVGDGILNERGFNFAINVPPNVAKNFLELMRSGQQRIKNSGGSEKPNIRMGFDLYNIKANHQKRPIFDVRGMYICEDGSGDLVICCNIVSPLGWGTLHRAYSRGRRPKDRGAW